MQGKEFQPSNMITLIKADLLHLKKVAQYYKQCNIYDKSSPVNVATFDMFQAIRERLHITFIKSYNSNVSEEWLLLQQYFIDNFSGIEQAAISSDLPSPTDSAAK